MHALDFPLWLAFGSYGGLICSMVAAIALALYALRRRRGTPRQLARAMLVALFSSAFMLVPIWWEQNRFNLYGPTVSARETLLFLLWTALAGWCVPLGTLVGYGLFAAPVATAPAPDADVPQRRPTTSTPLSPDLDDPARKIEPLGPGRAWGQLEYVLPPDSFGAERRPLPLTRNLTLLGREATNDIVIDDGRTSRHHAEIRWDRGRVQLVDLGSMNGTFVNRQAVRGIVPLASGDTIELGAQRFRFEMLVTPEALAEAQALRETEKMPGMQRPEGVGPAVRLLFLAVLTGDAAGTRYELGSPVTRLGRDVECEVRLTDPSVSRLHAQILRQSSGYFVTDVGSSNGTFLNGQRLFTPHPLQAGDVLQIGIFTLACEAAPGAEPEPPLHDDVPVALDAALPDETERAGAQASSEVTQALSPHPNSRTSGGHVPEQAGNTHTA